MPETVTTVLGNGPVVALGIDAGSTTCKLVGVDANRRIVAWCLEPMTPRVAEQAASMLAALHQAVPVATNVPLYATGYGRKLIGQATRSVTEITCHAQGVFADTGSIGTLVDIGGQDSKVIRIGPGGTPVDFAMNDKCAAGTGRFLENTAQRLGVALERIGPTALEAAYAEAITSTCTVFAESEIISLVAHGKPVNAILLGLHKGLVSRILAMVRGVGLTPPLLLSGGVACNRAIVQVLEELSGETVRLPSQPQLMGAYGAALLAAKQAKPAYDPLDTPASIPVISSTGTAQRECSSCKG